MVLSTQRESSDIDLLTYLGNAIKEVAETFRFPLPCLASRTDVDIDDIKFLIRLLGMKKKEEVYSILENIYPGKSIEPKVMYVIEGIFDEL